MDHVSCFKFLWWKFIKQSNTLQNIDLSRLVAGARKLVRTGGVDSDPSKTFMAELVA